jgi:hypothetical protein
MNNTPIEFLLVAGGICGLAGLFRMMISIAAFDWTQTLAEEVDALPTWNCERFHEIQNKPRPWYVVVNNWLEDRHI